MEDVSFRADPDGPPISHCEVCGTSASQTQVMTTEDPYAWEVFGIEELISICRHCYETRSEEADEY